MIKTLFVAVWSCLVMVGASFGATYLMKMQSTKSAEKPTSASFDTRKTRELNIPIIRDGAVRGYAVVQLNYVVDLDAAKKLPAPPDAFVVDETFQYIYNDEKIDFAHLDRVDIGAMTESLVQRVNTRLRSNVVTDMGVVEFNFLVNNEAKGKP